jgi:GT2 family glycosyltransferase
MRTERGSFHPASQISLLAPRATLPWTICVLFYGDHPDLCERFLDRLYRWTDPQAFRLRVGLNAVCAATKALTQQAAERYGNVEYRESAQNIYKCPMMQRMFAPLPNTEWTLWFDDDSHVTGPSWILDLAMAMEKVPAAELLGSLRSVDVSDHVEKFITTATWYRGVPRKYHAARQKRTIVFPVGGFWAVRTARIAETQWPDPRLTHFEDDYLMGEAMRQQGVQMVHFESGVCINDSPRRAPAEAPVVLRLDYPPVDKTNGG